MPNESTTAVYDADDRLLAAIASFEEARDAGLHPDPNEWLARYAEVATLLEEYFADQQRLQQVAGQSSAATAGAANFPEIPDYQILDLIGPGGMGVVYRALQISTNRVVALKVIRPDRLDDLAPEKRRKLVERFIAEAQAAAQLEHDHLVKVYEVGEYAGRPYYSMRYVEGESLHDLVGAGPLEPRRAAAYLEQVARAVHEAHQHGVLHRDLKPHNILLEARSDRPLIADFGLAKLLQGGRERTETGEVMGTPPYMSPEQAVSSAQVTVATDVYGLGATLYALLTGRPPFAADTPVATLKEVLEKDPVPPCKLGLSLPRDLEIICLKCLEKQPRKRYASAEELADRLRLFLENKPIPDRPAGRAERLGRWCQRNPTAAAVMVSLVVGIVTASALTIWALHEKGRADAKTGEAKRNEIDAQNNAESARKNAADARDQLCRLLVGDGLRYTEEGETARALLHFAEPLVRDSGNDELAETARMRVAAYRRYSRHTPLMHIFFHDGSLGGVRSASVSPDTRFIVTAYSDKARVWDLATGRPVTPPLQHRGEVFHASFSPDGRLVVTASDDGAARAWTARVWNAASGQLVAPPFEHDGSTGIQPWFSPDGRRLLTILGGNYRTVHVLDNGRVRGTGGGRAVRVWDVATGRPVTPPLQHREEVNHASFSPDGRRVVTASQDRSAQVWDAVTGQPVTPPLVHPSWVWHASFSPDGGRVVTMSSDACLWDATTGQLLLKYRGYYIPEQKRVKQSGRKEGLPLVKYGVGYFVSFSPDGRRVVTRGDGWTARVCDAASGQPITPQLPHRNWVMHASFSPDGRRVVTSDFDGTVRLWDATTGEPLSPPLRHQSPVHQAMFSPDGSRVVTTCFKDRIERLSPGPSERVALARVWDVAEQQTQQQTLLHERVVSSVAVSADGFRIVTAGSDGTARVWDAITGQPITPPLPHGGPVTSASFSPDGRHVVTCCQGGNSGHRHPVSGQTYPGSLMRVWDATTGQPITPPQQHYPSDTTLRGWSSDCDASFSPDGRLVVTSSGSSARVWDSITGKPVAPPMESSGTVHHASFSPNGRLVLTAGAQAQLWDAASGKLVATFRHQAMGVSASFSPDGRYVVTASADTMARVWDVTTGQPTTPLLQHGHEVVHASFSPDGRRVVTASRDGTGRVWDATSGDPLTPTMYHRGAVTALFSRDGRRVVTASMDNTVRVWDATTGQPITPLLKHADRVKHEYRGIDASFTPDGRRVVTACRDGQVQIWDISPDERPTADLVRLTHLLHGHRLDKYGGLVPLTSEELHSLWEELRVKYPQDFTVSPDRVLAWHRREAEQCLKEKDGPAALFHLLHGGLEWPVLWGRPIR